MKVSEKDVQYVEDLANLELTPDERVRMVKDLNAILGYIDRLNELDTSNVEPMAQVSSRYGVDAGKQSPHSISPMREDEVTPSLAHDEAMKNAPKTDGTFFKVPRVIER